MSLLFQLVAVATVIAVMMALRMLINRQLMRQRLEGKTGHDCEEKECFGGCGGQRRDTNRARTQ